MKQYSITAQVEKGEVVARFTLNHSVGIKKPLVFKNIEDAKGAPLIQQLFYLPFVKEVSLLENCIEVIRFDILEWEDVLEEVREQLENYLNEGGVLLEELPGVKIPVSVYAESTPNPAVMKFVANKKLVDTPVEYKSIEEAKKAPLAFQLFHFPFVKEVFISANYVSIMKYDVNNWDEVVMEIREFIRAFIEEGKTLVEEFVQKEEKTEKTNVAKTLDPLENQIISILEEYIKPAVASDGGNIAFDSYNPVEKSVQVVLQGACSGCPSSTFTLKNGIENMLKEMMPGKVESVVALNG
jgi:Fe-S cluster biogenesis protein NfuA